MVGGFLGATRDWLWKENGKDVEEPFTSARAHLILQNILAATKYSHLIPWISCKIGISGLKHDSRDDQGAGMALVSGKRQSESTKTSLAKLYIKINK